jgi:hypothetical protein
VNAPLTPPIVERRPRGVPYTTHDRRAPGVVLRYASADRKLAPIGLERHDLDWHALRPYPRGPYVAATYTSIAATCPSACAFRESGCYVREGFTGRAMRLLDDRAVGLTGDEVIELEAKLITRAFRRGGVPQDGGRDGDRGRDLRLHIGGDAASQRGAELLAGAADRWMERGGGSVWTYTHLSDEIDVDAWGLISALASVETPRAARRAIDRGYVPAIVLPRFPAETRRPFELAGVPGWRALACPAETRGLTCVQCRACLSDGPLRDARVAIAFEAHGTNGGTRARRALQVIA